MRIPGDEKGVIKLAKEMIEVCGVSIGQRGAVYQQYAQLIETGRDSGGLSLANTLYAHVDRLASHLFCPTDARFTIDFESQYSKEILLQAEQAARLVTRAFGRNNFDTCYAGSVFQGLSYGASFIKLAGKSENISIDGRDFSHIKEATSRVVPPWLIGVENEGRTGLDDQEAICETVYLNKYDVWRRIAHFPDRDKMWKRIQSHSNKGAGPALPSSFIQMLSASALNISPTAPTTPGGMVNITSPQNYATTGPNIMSDQYVMNELWVWDDDRSDYLMIQMIEPDILIAPRYKRTNEFCPSHHPYILVQPNESTGYFWGRSEIVDLIMLQAALTETMDDFRRLIGVQYDKRVAFEGFDGDPQELYDDFRSAGWVSGRAGSKVTDMTPALPAGAIEYIKLLMSTMQDVSGFGNILSGQGEAGVRAGNHANALIKTASPRLRDRSLLVERQYAGFGDKYLHYMQAKDGNQYFYDANEPAKTSFLLAQLPDDRRVMVDSHSSSPIYEQDHNNLTAFALKANLIDGARAIDMLNIPDKDEAKREFKERQAAQQQTMQQMQKEHPEIFAKMMGGGRSR